MAYASLKSKPRRPRLKPGHYEQHVTGWYYLYRLLHALRLKGLATLVFAKPRTGWVLYKNRKPWKSAAIIPQRRFTLVVRPQDLQQHN